MATSGSPLPSPHVLLFPFMSKGHIIPLMHLAKLIHRHRPSATFTVFTTTGNHHFVLDSLSPLPSHLLTIIPFPFPSHPDIPPGVESTDKLPSMSLFFTFMDAIEGLQPCFETALKNLHTTTCFLISDGFLSWTQESASKFKIPRLEFYGMSSYSHTLTMVLGQNRTLVGSVDDNELIQVPDFPWIRVTNNDFDTQFMEWEPKGPKFDFVFKSHIAGSKSFAMLVNSFYEIESKFLDHWNSKFQPKAWPIGPFYWAESHVHDRAEMERPFWIKWLDQKMVENKPVLYISFGTQAEISDNQLREIVIGLESSGVDFLWALRVKPEQEEVIKEFERGLVVREWIGQREVLEHESVEGFLSHCGWNSVTESICEGVPILAWPMMADQHLNARMVTEEIKVGLRVETCNGSVRGFVKWEGLSKMIKELIGCKDVRRRVKELSKVAKEAIEEGGSSWCNIESLLNELEVIST